MLARVDSRALALLCRVPLVAVAGGGGRVERDPDLYVIVFEISSKLRN